MPFDPTDYAISKVADLLLELGKRQILREPDVVAVLRRHGIETLKDTFESIYVNTVAAVALEGKLRPLLALFKDRKVAEAFEESWRIGDRVIFSNEALHAIEALAAGDEVKSLNLDVQVQIEHFETVFRKLVQQARSPGQQEVVTLLQQILAEVRRAESTPSIFEQFSSFSLERRFFHKSDFVGRKFELEEFGTLVNGVKIKSEARQEPPYVVLVSGEGGMGKSWLVNELCAIGEDESLKILSINFDGEIEQETQPEGLLQALAQQAREAGLGEAFTEFDRSLFSLRQTAKSAQGSQNILALSSVEGQKLVAGEQPEEATRYVGYLGRKNIARLTKELINGLNRVSLVTPLLIVLDTYEKSLAIEDWLEEHLVRLSGKIILLVSGQRDTEINFVGKFGSSALHHWKLKALSRAEIGELLQSRKLSATEEMQNTVLRISQGIPIAVAICSTRLANTDSSIRLGRWEPSSLEAQTVESVVTYWLTDMSSDQKELLFAMSIFWWFDEEALQMVLQRSDIPNVLEYAKAFPFLSLLEYGWRVHDRIRLFMMKYLAKARPNLLRLLHKRAAMFWAGRARELEEGLSPSQYYFKKGWGTCINSRLYHLLQSNELEGLKFLLANFIDGLKQRSFFVTLIELTEAEEIQPILTLTPEYAELLRRLIIASQSRNRSEVCNILSQLAFAPYLIEEQREYLKSLIDQVSASALEGKHSQGRGQSPQMGNRHDESDLDIGHFGQECPP